MADNKWKIGIFVFIALAIAIAGYFLFFPLRGDIAGKQVKLTIGTAVSNSYVASVWVAQSKKFFKDEGLEVEIKEFSSGVKALEAMLKEGSPDIVMPANLPVVFKSFVSDDYAIFAGFGRNDDFNKLLAREDRGIKVPADLKGKKIGTTEGTTGHYFLGLFLDANKLKISDVEVINLKGADFLKALAEGQVDAISAWEPYIENAKKIMGADVRAFSSKGILNEYFYFVARKDFIKNNQNALRKFLKAVEKGNRFLRNHPLESIDIVSEKSKIDKLTVISLWDDYKFDLFLDQTVLSSLEEQANWAIKNKLVDATKIPDYRSYIYTEILDKINHKGVNRQ